MLYSVCNELLSLATPSSLCSPNSSLEGASTLRKRSMTTPYPFLIEEMRAKREVFSCLTLTLPQESTLLKTSMIKCTLSLCLTEIALGQISLFN